MCTGHEFSEEDFLNPPEVSGSQRLDDRARSKVVTSAYFTPAQDTHMDHDSTSGGNKEHSIVYSSSDSHSYSEHPTHDSLAHQGRERKSHRHHKQEVSSKGHSEKLQSDKPLSEVFSFPELDDHQPWSSYFAESQLPIPAPEVAGEETMMYEVFLLSKVRNIGSS